MKNHRYTKHIVFIVAFTIVISSTGLIANGSQNGKIAFTRTIDGNSGIYLMNEDGSNQTRITDNNTNDVSPAWSPNGRQIAFVNYRSDGNAAICVMNADGTSKIVVTPLDTDLTNLWPGGLFSPSWSPDGRRIAFVGNNDIYVVNIDGTNLLNLTADPFHLDLDPTWSPDGSKILFTRYDRYPPVGYGGTMLHTISPNGTGMMPIPNGFADGWNEDSPHWSSTTNKIIYSVNRWDFSFDLYTANPDGTGRTFFEGCGIAFNNCGLDSYDAEFSPDGSKAVFVKYETAPGSSQKSKIYVKDVNGATIKLLTDNGASPSWQRLAEGSISGRIFAPNMQPIRNAVVMLTDSNGIMRSTTTSAFGYYIFEDVVVPGSYAIEARSKRYRFTRRNVNISENLLTVDMTGME